MKRSTKIIIISSVVAIVGSIVLFIYSQDAKRKKYSATNVTPAFAKDVIDSVARQYGLK